MYLCQNILENDADVVTYFSRNIPFTLSLPCCLEDMRSNLCLTSSPSSSLEESSSPAVPIIIAQSINYIPSIKLLNKPSTHPVSLSRHHPFICILDRLGDWISNISKYFYCVSHGSLCLRLSPCSSLLYLTNCCLLVNVLSIAERLDGQPIMQHTVSFRPL